jgi:5-methyltetrahydropteroyltriglutamate--homocysteine methyltransferase
MRPSTQRFRAESIGSLLQPEYLLSARLSAQSGAISPEELRAAEDCAVNEAIALQEDAGLDVVTDGEMRRPTWHDTSRHLLGLETALVPLNGQGRQIPWP